MREVAYIISRIFDVLIITVLGLNITKFAQEIDSNNLIIVKVSILVNLLFLF